ncbi:ribonuclease H-like domain-containing protein [Tanacetum coccineum]
MSVHNSEHNAPINSNHDDDVHDPVTRISKLDISDPLHLHPNDTIALTVISIKLKGTKNYQYDAIIELPKCICNASEGFKKHNQLLKLILFLMGLDDSYMQIRSSILSIETLRDVRSAYATISSEVSHKVVVGIIAGANQHMIYTDKELDNVINISHLIIKVGHPNGTEAYISKIRNLILSNGLTLYDVMIIPEYCVTLISVHKLAKENKHDWHCRLGHLVERVMNVLKGDLVHLNLWGPYKVTSSEEFRLPSFVLNGKSPYEMIYKKCPTLSHLRVFGCLCFATIVNNNDKFSSRSEKCVMIGYSNFKKGYRLYSLDKYQFIFLKDVKFFENIFPFKDSELEKNKSANVFQDVNHINFFDIEYSKIPNDDERVANDLNNGKSDSSSSFVSSSNINTADFPVDYRNDAE